MPHAAGFGSTRQGQLLGRRAPRVAEYRLLDRLRPAHARYDRPYIERFFRTIATDLSGGLPGYTGSGARHLRRPLADPKRDLTVEHSCVAGRHAGLAFRCQATWTCRPGDRGTAGSGHRDLQRNAARWPNSRIPLGTRRAVRGYLQQGHRAHINFRASGTRIPCSPASGTGR